MRVFGVVSGRSGDVGFSGPLLGVSSGDGGFNGCCSGERSGVVGFKVATLSRLVREKVRPARSKHPKIGAYLRAGRVFSRTGRRGVPRGEFVATRSWPLVLLLAVLTLRCAATPT